MTSILLFICNVIHLKEIKDLIVDQQIVFKLIIECTKKHRSHLIIKTSFKQRKWKKYIICYVNNKTRQKNVVKVLRNDDEVFSDNFVVKFNSIEIATEFLSILFQSQLNRWKQIQKLLQWKKKFIKMFD